MLQRKGFSGLDHLNPFLIGLKKTQSLILRCSYFFFLPSNFLFFAFYYIL
jgi:hypothetical protein